MTNSHEGKAIKHRRSKPKKPKVFIAESVNSKNIYKGEREGLAISEILNLLGIESLYRQIFDKQRLKQSLREANRRDFANGRIKVRQAAELFSRGRFANSRSKI
jgi:hypothetical protein